MDEAPVFDVEVVASRSYGVHFDGAHEREALSTQWNFPVVWQAQQHEIAALERGRIVGVLGLRIAASLAHVDSLIVEPRRRRAGIGRALLERAESLAKYYNCHKVTLEVPAEGSARAFFEACGYKLEAVLRAAHVEARRRHPAKVYSLT